MEKPAPTVSVILTSFNHARYLPESIESVLGQSYEDFELIIWDDASTDKSWEIIQSYRDCRIRAFRNYSQRFSTYGVNKAILELSRGSYIAIHHSDDIWMPTKLEKQIAVLDNHLECAAAFTWTQIIDEDGRCISNDWFNHQSLSRWELLYNLFIGNNYLCHPSVLIRKNCYERVGVYRLDLRQATDAEMWTRVLICSDVNIIPERLTHHRLNSDGSNTSSQTLANRIRAENEWNILRLNYFKMANADQVLNIFPSLESFRANSDSFPEFLLAIACLYECQSRSAWALGLTKMHELLSNKEIASRIGQTYCYGCPDLIELSAMRDSYAIAGDFERWHNADLSKRLESQAAQLILLQNEIGTQSKCLREYELKLTLSKSKNDDLEKDLLLMTGRLNNVLSSKSWRVTRPVRFIARYFCQICSQVLRVVKVSRVNQEEV
jgi:glycosyltransferase involved in cell wall biosynthesis